MKEVACMKLKYEDLNFESSKHQNNCIRVYRKLMSTARNEAIE